MILKKLKYIRANAVTNKTLVYALAIILFFLLACWGIWVFFDHRISGIEQGQLNTQ